MKRNLILIIAIIIFLGSCATVKKFITDKTSAAYLNKLSDLTAHVLTKDPKTKEAFKVLVKDVWDKNDILKEEKQKLVSILEGLISIQGVPELTQDQGKILIEAKEFLDKIK